MYTILKLAPNRTLPDWALVPLLIGFVGLVIYFVYSEVKFWWQCRLEEKKNKSKEGKS